jgi:Flp pilus assembly protein TadG
MTRLFRNLRQSEDGQALVELALVLPVLLIVLLAIVDFGRAVNYWNDENHLANLGARYAAVGTLPTSPPCGTSAPLSNSTLTAFIDCEAGIDSTELEKGSGSTTGTQGPLSVCVKIPNPQVGEPVTVTVRAKFNWLPMPTVVGGKKLELAQTTLSGSATMRLEQPSSLTTTSEC